MKRRVADIIMDVLVKQGITDCFAVVGGGAMHLNNALGLNNSIHKIFNHHEQACAMAAEAYARISGRMAAVCVTSGPGATNALTGVMGAWQDSLPILVLSGQVRYELTVEKSGLPLRYRGIQEFDILHSIQNMTKYAVMLKDPLEVKRELLKAIHIAMSGRRGPVWLEIPLDVQSALVEEDNMYLPEKTADTIPKASLQEWNVAIQKLKQAKRPCVLVGNGVANSGNIQRFRRFAEDLRIPVIAATISADAMYTDCPYYYGMSGSMGLRCGNFIVQNADVILSVGCSLGFKMTGYEQEMFAPKAYMIAVDIDENEMRKPGVRVDQFIHSDLSAFFDVTEDTTPQIETKKEWFDYCDSLRARFSPFEPGDNKAPDERVCMYYFWKRYQEFEPEDSISALGNNTANSAKLQIGIKCPKQRIITNNNCGSMGLDLPGAIGAAVVTKKQVICLTGDGSIMMNLQELQTIKHNNLPIKIVVFSNDGYNAIRQTCKNYFHGVQIGCSPDSGVSFPAFSKIADAFGYEYYCCHSNREVDDALKWLFESEGQVLLEVKQLLDDPVTPRVMSRMLPDGTFATPALQDMSPFLDQDEYEHLMLW